MASYTEIQSFLREKDLTKEDFENLLSIAKDKNWKIKGMLDCNNHWSNIGIVQLRLIYGWCFENDLAAQQ